MKTFLFLLAALVCEQSSAGSVEIGFPEAPFAAVEGDEFDICVEALGGTATSDIELTVMRSYAVGACK